MKRVILAAIALLCVAAGPREWRDKNTPRDAELNRIIAASAPTLYLDPDAPTEGEPLVHYKLEDNAASTAVVDSSGNYAGTASANTNGFCNTAATILKGCTFAVASSHKVDTGADTLAAGADSVCAWVKPADATLAAAQDIADNGKAIFFIHTDGKLGFTSDGTTTVYSTAALADGAFAHVCVTRTATGAASFYINGALNGAAGQASGTPEAGSGNVFIGNNAAADRDYGGILDDVRIYPRALTPTEIQNIYKSGTGHQNQATSSTKAAIVVDNTNPLLVGAWQDNHGIEFVQATDAAKPLLGKLNGRRVLVFDGTDDYLASTTTFASIWAANASSLMAVVGKPSSTALDKSIFGAGNGYGYGAWWGYPTDGGMGVILTDSGGAKNLAIEASNTNNIFTVTHNGTMVKGRAGGATTYLAVGNLAALTGTLEIGGANGANNLFSSSIGPIITWNKVKSDTVLQPIERALALKYGVNYKPVAEMSCDNYIRSLTPTLWLDSSDLSTITKDVNNKVSEWRSKIGAVTFTQATAANQPTWTGDGVSFTKANSNFMASIATTDSIYNVNAKSFFVLYQIAAGSTQQGLMGAASEFAIDAAENAITTTVYNYDAGGWDYPAAATITRAVKNLLDGTHNGTNLLFRINGGADLSTASGNTNSVTGALYLGAQWAASGYYDGTIGSVLTFDAVLTADQRARVRSCLGSKYGVSF